MAYTAKDGKKFGNNQTGKLYDQTRPTGHPASPKAPTPHAHEGGHTDASETDVSHMPIHEVVAKHGPAHEVHVTHDHEAGSHHVESHHAEAVHHSDHGTAEEAHS